MTTKPELSFAVETITPAIAEQYLETNKRNRQCSQKVAGKYARIIERGEWMLNGEAIKFSSDDQLLDGQHRLHAVIKTGKPIDTVVIRGLEAEAFKTMDACKVRSQGDYLHVLGYKYTVPLATAARILYTFERGHTGHIRNFRNISNEQLLGSIKRHPGLVPAAYEFMHKPLYTKLVPASVGMFVFFIAKETDKVKACRFFQQLASEQHPAQAQAKDPIRVLRECLVARDLEVIKPTSLEKMSWLVDAWNHFLQGGQMTRLSRIVEHMPRFHRNPIKLVRDR